VRGRVPEQAMKDLAGFHPIDTRMATPPTPPISDDHLVRYLLGTLPPDDAERLDERCFVDEELAERLRVVEDDLVDSYAARTLAGERLQRFEAYYLSSPRRRSKAAFAKGLRAALERTTHQPRPVPNLPAQHSRTVRPRFWWPLAAAAAVVAGIAVLLVQNVSLRRELRNSGEQVAVADRRATAASQQLEAEQKAAAAAKQALADARTAEPLAVALVLLPQTRGITSVPIMAVPSGSTGVPLDLALEAAGGASYDVALRDPATNRTIWRSPPLAPHRVRHTPIVPVLLPAGLLKAQHYALDLFELRSGHAPEFVSSYALEVVRQ
jgi:hypothetical protein